MLRSLKSVAIASNLIDWCLLTNCRLFKWPRSRLNWPYLFDSMEFWIFRNFWRSSFVCCFLCLLPNRQMLPDLINCNQVPQIIFSIIWIFHKFWRIGFVCCFLCLLPNWRMLPDLINWFFPIKNSAWKIDPELIFSLYGIGLNHADSQNTTKFISFSRTRSAVLLDPSLWLNFPSECCDKSTFCHQLSTIFQRFLSCSRAAKLNNFSDNPL